MKTTYWLQITLESDAAFSRGDGVPGVVNADVQHDRYGLPYLGGKTLKGLLSSSCAEVLSAIKQTGAADAQKWEASAGRLFGQPGGGPEDAGCLHVSDARLPDDLCQGVAADVKTGKMTAADVLESLTALRRQTAMSAETGAPLRNSLRTIRIILRETVFAAQIEFIPLLGGRQISEAEGQQDLALLAASVKALRRAGAHRNRGLGKIRLEMFEAYPFQGNVSAITSQSFKAFKQGLVGGQEAQP